MAEEDFAGVFARLRSILAPYAPQMEAATDAPGAYYLNTGALGPNKKPLPFAGVEVKKNYVSYHLFPVYMYPDLLDGMSDGLRKRMQGKSCFNFKAINAGDEALLAELEQLTGAGAARLRREKVLPAG